MMLWFFEMSLLNNTVITETLIYMCFSNDRVMFFHWYMGQIHHVMAGIAVYSKQLYTIYALKVDWNKYTSTFGHDVEFMYGQYLLTFIEYILIFFTSAASASSSLASVFLVYYVILIDLRLTMMCTLLYHFFFNEFR